MAKLGFTFISGPDPDVMELMLDAEFLPNAAAQLLGHVAGYLERGEPVPTLLASWVARAFKSTAKVRNPEGRPAKLAAGLGLTQGTKPRKQSTLRIGKWVSDFKHEQACSENHAVEAAACEFGLGRSTVWDHLRLYKKARLIDL
jgi:hypothetical protein